MFMRKYETVVLVSPESGDEGVQKATNRLREGLEKTQAKEIRLEDWGVKRLAYELNGNRRAHYLYLHYLGTNKTVAEIERLMKITEAVIKYQTVFLEDRVDPAQFDFAKESKSYTELAKRAKAKAEARKVEASA
ncbi:MAG: 30S ribosomal protein S6 [Deltaproteobacteria bacterium]|jgi:small subunit ribosomal protein S6|nr:30S ribosomal protein S6 [Deltaproteobacteria bacterium]